MMQYEHYINTTQFGLDTTLWKSVSKDFYNKL